MKEALWLRLAVLLVSTRAFTDLSLLENDSSNFITDYISENKQIKKLRNMKVQKSKLAQLENSPKYLMEHQTIFSSLKRSGMKLKEWISDSNVLLAIIIGIIVVFLVVCCLCFYCAFYPDGIPEHLKKDNKKQENPEENQDDKEKEPLM